MAGFFVEGPVDSRGQERGPVASWGHEGGPSAAPTRSYTGQAEPGSRAEVLVTDCDQGTPQGCWL